ncbi:hypothetical protein XA68_10398 [Ophiocordyceps unilateralis]|uniref:Uncharacterized protein n=1 Tax=Ophiocordyceps unilateralis TaxID=268505 RepID=A0A2A9PRC7_OPHUN|nr:hypothetical protein XA68_10398 [Ophiocordyceps unilateralis]
MLKCVAVFCRTQSIVSEGSTVSGIGTLELPSLMPGPLALREGPALLQQRGAASPHCSSSPFAEPKLYPLLS